MSLKKSDIKKFKERLEELEGQLTKTIKGTAAEVTKPDEATGYSQHQADQGTDDFDRTIGLELTSREYELLKQIRRALQKIEEDSYGICDDTGEEIPEARLRAIPWATLTVKAQEKREKGRRAPI